MSVSSLFDNALHTVMRDFPLHEHQLYALPRSVKTKLMMSVTKRGIFSERNMASVRIIICPVVKLTSQVYTYRRSPLLVKHKLIYTHYYDCRLDKTVCYQVSSQYDVSLM